MLVFGAGGFAKEVLEIIKQDYYFDNLIFYDDVNTNKKLFLNEYKVINNEKCLIDFFKNNDNSFCIGIGNPYNRSLIYEKFIDLGGSIVSIISSKSNIGTHDVSINKGCVILQGVNISNSVLIGKCVIIYYNSVITHDCQIGDFVEISPSVNVLGNVKIGDYTKLGANSTILPNINIGKGVIVGAGAVVTRNIPDYSVVVGVPARIIKKIR